MDLESLPTAGKQPSLFHEPSHHLLFDSFSWLDDNDDLDLRLTLDDDHHVDTQSSRPMTTTRASSMFRRRLSVNKLSLSRSSISSSRPGTKDSFSTQQTPTTTHSRRKSRAFSLMTLKHAPQASIASIDTAAAHYQDPEARHKLRAYLASPQKFDEALKFGFPADNAHSAIISKSALRKSRSFSQDLFMASSEKLKTFLADDHSSVYSQETSIPDSESPRTPHTPEAQPPVTKPFHFSTSGAAFPSKLSECPGQGGVNPREMTLRMTLTRPDLRSRQEDSHAWPNNITPHLPRLPSHSRPQSRLSRLESPVLASANKDATKEGMDQIFADIDRELSSSSEGVVKRLWKRVRRG
ncbi:hypothetical protein F5Y14DRAFT_139283 [Nemania sp. NC0429]|nr:hypothetical protein F5Y14DRAFT_139283 [Nemania sp. NC0429]